MKTRSCAVAGMFYPKRSLPSRAAPGRIFLRHGARVRNSLGIVCPHAGYIYSGQVAAHAFSTDSSPSFPARLLSSAPPIAGICPALPQIPWETPLGIVDTDTEFIRALDIEIDELHPTRKSIRSRYRCRLSGPVPRAQDRSCADGGAGSAQCLQLCEKIVAAQRTDETGCPDRCVERFLALCARRKAKTDVSMRSKRLRGSTWKSFTGGSGTASDRCGYGPIVHGDRVRLAWGKGSPLSSTRRAEM